jgi:integrase
MLPDARVVRSLEVKRDNPALAITYATALNTLCDRGDWNVVRRWADGDVHITEIARAVREGDYTRLNRLNIAGTLLGGACDDFNKRARATLKGRNSARTYEDSLQQLRNAWGDDFPMASATTAAAEKFLHEPKLTAKGRPWAPKTQAARREVYRALWAFVIEREAEEAEQQGAQPSVTKNPWVKAKVPKRRRTRHSFLNPAQWYKLVNHPRVLRTPRAAFLSAGMMGLRRAEIQHLRTGMDVLLDVERPVLRVQDREGGRHRKWRTKTENSLRDVPIPAALLDHFRYHAEHYAGEDYFFTPEGGDHPLANSTVIQWVSDSFRAAGLRYGREGDALTLHSLRHTYITWLLSAGVPLMTVARLAGDSARTILQTYAHHMPSDEAKADAALNEAFK